jgi:alginate O-acetyltransferase complex protein AlgI
VNIFITMVLGGIWHGAGINFMIWGALHGCFIVINHLWRDYVVAAIPIVGRSKLLLPPAYVLTMACVMLGWVFFRSETLGGAYALAERMFWLPSVSFAGDFPVTLRQFSLILCAGLIVTAFPNSRQIHDWSLAGEARQLWIVGALSGAVFAVAFVSITADSPFLYFQF